MRNANCSITLYGVNNNNYLEFLDQSDKNYSKIVYLPISSRKVNDEKLEHEKIVESAEKVKETELVKEPAPVKEAEPKKSEKTNKSKLRLYFIIGSITIILLLLFIFLIKKYNK